MKSLAKKIVVTILGWQIRRLYKKNEIKVVVVTGSVGKTSTKWAIGNVLKQKYKTQFQEGNYNDIVTVPLIFFGRSTPSLFNPLAWGFIFLSNELALLRKYPYEIVVVELGSDGPGQLQQFKKYLRAEIGVLTAITPEHMEYFEDIKAVADEEKVVSELSTLTLINKDMCPPQYTKIEGALSYGIKQDGDFTLRNISFDNEGCNFDVLAGSSKIFSARHEAISEPQLYSILAAVAVAHKLDLNSEEIEAGIATIKPVAGRMQQLKGVNNSLILDDTYNASPEAVKAALDTLYRLGSSQKIAVLGNMNELGKYSEEEHKKIGNYCDPKQLELVVTIGPDANKFTAEAAEAKGCKVQRFDSPYAAGDYLKSLVTQGGLILVKGSQNGVFAEETVKILLDNPSDSTKLVRQDMKWLVKKSKAFNK